MSDTDLSALRSFLRDDPPEGLAEVSQDAIHDLVNMCEAAQRAQVQQISRAIDEALRLVPRPFRGVVKRVIGA